MKHARPPHGRLGILAATALILAAPLLGLTTHASAQAAAAACRHINGPFHREGNKVFNSRGQRFIPYGYSVTDLGSPRWDEPWKWKNDAQEIQVSAANCANTDRIQVFQDALVGVGGNTVNHAFLAQIEADVTEAEGLGLVVAINDQSEGAAADTEYMPNRETRRFWKVITGIYGHDPDVIFDLFNEPRRADFSTERATWHFWKYGGRYAGQQWMGMQPLARYLRSLDAKNLFWIEGPHTAGTLQYVRQYQVAKAGPVEYAINHAGPTTGPHDAAYWDSKFGLASRYVPMTDSEWTNYASASKMCWPDAPRSVPAFLRYLAEHGMGLTAWTLAPGVLVTDKTMSTPTRIKSDWRCVNRLDEGAGSQIRAWFYLHNG